MSRALVAGSAANRAQAIGVLRRAYGFECVEVDDPYAAMRELCARKTVYNALIVSLASLYREELSLIAAVKRRFAHLEIWLTHTDGRQAALAEALTLGADGLLGEEGLHRTAPIPTARETQPYAPVSEAKVEQRASSPPAEAGRADAGRTEAGRTVEQASRDEAPSGEPVLSADELRALLQDQPAMPPAGNPPET